MSSTQELPNTGWSGLVLIPIGLIAIGLGKLLMRASRRGAALHNKT